VTTEPARLLVLLLPERLEAFAHRGLAEGLLRAGGVVVVDPPRAGYASLARIPDAFGVTIASKQARRLRRRLPGVPGAVAIFDPGQYPLARGLLAQVPDCELWYGPVVEPADGAQRRQADLHAMAAGRAAVRFDPAADHDALWPDLARLGIGG
jgi:hypothetical protein